MRIDKQKVCIMKIHLRIENILKIAKVVLEIINLKNLHFNKNKNIILKNLPNIFKWKRVNI